MTDHLPSYAVALRAAIQVRTTHIATARARLQELRRPERQMTVQELRETRLLELDIRMCTSESEELAAEQRERGRKLSGRPAEHRTLAPDEIFERTPQHFDPTTYSVKMLGSPHGGDGLNPTTMIRDRVRL